MLNNLTKSFKVMTLIGLVSFSSSTHAEFDIDTFISSFAQGLSYGPGTTIVGLVVKDAYDTVKEEFGSNKLKNNIEQYNEKKSYWNFLEDQLNTHQKDHGCSPSTCSLNRSLKLDLIFHKIQLKKDLAAISSCGRKTYLDNSIIQAFNQELAMAKEKLSTYEVDTPDADSLYKVDATEEDLLEEVYKNMQSKLLKTNTNRESE